MHGEIRLGRRRQFIARQVLSTDGFVWAARTRLGGLTVSGFDPYARGSGECDGDCWASYPSCRRPVTMSRVVQPGALPAK